MGGGGGGVKRLCFKGFFAQKAYGLNAKNVSGVKVLGVKGPALPVVQKVCGVKCFWYTNKVCGVKTLCFACTSVGIVEACLM